MPTQDILLSLKFNNYNYAPGIATYGIDGKTGQAGIDGNNIYFTDCNLLTDTDDDLKILAELIANNYLPVKGSTTQINRSYKNNDLFFDYNGIIYQLTHIDDLIGNKDIGGIYSDYFNIAGKINIADINNIFTWVDDRMILNTSSYSGYDIVTINNPNNALDYINKDAAINIISDKVNENSNIEMIKMQSIDDVDIEDGNLSVYYKTTENAFYLDSNKPIVINGDVKLNNDNNTNNEYDNFSTILTSNDTVTYFKHICDKLRYNILYDSDVNRYKLVIYLEDSGSDDLEYLVNRNETVYGKVYDGENNLILLKLDTLIKDNVLVDVSHYWDNLPNYILTTSDCNYNTSSLTFYACIVGNFSVYTINNNNINVSIANNDNKNGLNIDISINYVISQYPVGQLFNSSLLAIDILLETALITGYKINKLDYNGPLISPIDLFTYIEQNYPALNGIYKFTFDTNNFYNLKNIIINIYSICYSLEFNANKIKHLPFINIIYSFNNNEIESGKYTLYFTTVYSKEKFSIKNLMLFNNDNLEKLQELMITDRPCIVSYLPDSVESVQRFSLLHNTEVFINYQE